jgi:hypothetical protein
MRYLAECPRCHTRVGRVAYLRWGIARQCVQCHTRLKENARYAWWWSIPFFGPGGVMIGLAVCGVVIWELAISVFVISMVLGYVLFPYVTKLEIVDKETKHDESPAA